MRDNLGGWQPITPDKLHQLLATELALCSPEDAALLTKIKVDLKKVRFDRGTFAEDVFIVAQSGDKVIFYDDIEDGFEVGVLAADNVIRNAGLGQFSICEALAHLRLGWR